MPLSNLNDNILGLENRSKGNLSWLLQRPFAASNSVKTPLMNDQGT
jgi:hypothetical protein